jgi:hypothetical protein
MPGHSAFPIKELGEEPYAERYRGNPQCGIAQTVIVERTTNQRRSNIHEHDQRRA